MKDTAAIESLRRRAGISEDADSPGFPNVLPENGAAARTLLEELVNKKDDDRVVALVAGLDPDAAWADLALRSYTRQGDWDKARQYFDFCLAHDHKRVALPSKAMAMGLGGLLDPVAEQILVPTKGMDQARREFAESILHEVERKLDYMILGTGVESALDHDICKLFVQVVAWIGQRERAEKAIALLVRDRREFPHNIVGMMDLGHLPASKEVIDKIRIDSPRDLDAFLLTAQIEDRYLGEPARAFSQLVKKSYLAKSDSEIHSLNILLKALAESSREPELIKVADTRLSASQYSDPTVRSLSNVMQLIESGDVKAAAIAMQEGFDQDNPQWHRIKAAFHLAQNEPKEAANSIFDAAKLSSHWREFFQAAELAYGCNDWPLAGRCLEHALELNPTDMVIRYNLVVAYERQGRFDQIEQLLEDGLPIHEDDVIQYENISRLLLQAGKYEQALQVLSSNDELLNKQLSTVTLRASLIRMIDGPEQAYKFLGGFEDCFSEQKELWFALLDLAYAAGDDDGGHIAFTKLLELKQKGLVSDKELWTQSLDDLKEIITNRAEQQQKIASFIGSGKLPWLIGSEMDHRSAWISWMLCTQPLKYLIDNPKQKIAFSVYASNGFAPKTTNASQMHLEEVQAPTTGSAVVADISALMTLTQLELLEVAQEYFGEIYVPVEYTVLLANEARQLQPHQKSTFDSANKLVAAISEHKVSPIAIEEASEFLSLDPHNVLELENRHGFKRLLEYLLGLGRLPQEDFDRAEVLFSQDKDLPAGGAELVANAKLIVEESAMRMLAQYNILDVVCGAFDVFVPDCDVKQLELQIRAYQSLEGVRKANERLAKWIGRSHIKKRGTAEEGLLGGLGDWSSKAYELSRQLNLPLLADDRCWHAMKGNETGNRASVAFDTSSFLNSVRANDLIDVGKYANAFLNLVDWRYKFLVVPAEVMYVAAAHYRKGLPGEELRRIARYIHDCTSDTAMFSGLENVQPPTSMSVRWTVSLASEVAKFLVAVWADDEISDDQAGEVTVWSARSLMPSMIASQDEAQRVRLSSQLPQLALNHYALAAANEKQLERMHAGFRTFAFGLGLDREASESVIENLVLRILEDGE